jgi:hypothetical protein
VVRRDPAAGDLTHVLVRPWLSPRALPLPALPAAAKPAAQADVAEDDAARGALAAHPETPAPPLSRLAVRRHDPRWEPGAVVPLAGICAGAASNRRPYRDAAFSMAVRRETGKE